MVNVSEYTRALVEGLIQAFGARLLYVGLQGSYRRGEADEQSDVDAMVVLDALSPADLDAYRGVISRLSEGARACGFIGGREDMRGWNPCEAYQLLCETRDLYGELAPLLPPFGWEDVRAHARTSVCNLYHEICHRYIYQTRQRNEERLPLSYKSVFYILQHLNALRGGGWAISKAELLARLWGDDRRVLETAVALRKGGGYDFDAAFALLHRWCRQTIAELEQPRKFPQPLG